MPTRIALRAAALVAPVVVLAAAFVVFSTPAGASGPTNGAIILGSAVPTGSYTAGAPFDSGQNIEVSIPANDVFSATDPYNNNHSSINIVECSAPNGVVPTDPVHCDGNTIQGLTIIANTDGSFVYTGYTVYALPDSVALGETPTDTRASCGNTAATECILYIGNNQNDFIAPHVWSQPFFVNANGNDLGGNPGDGGNAPLPTSGQGPAYGSIVAGAAFPTSPYTPRTPFDSGQNIDVTIPANDVFSASDPYGNNNEQIGIVECSAPNGVPPTSPNQCDTLTESVGNLFPSADGSFTYTGYTVYALPDSISLGETSDGPVCGNTTATECILYIGNIGKSAPDQSLNMALPHVWSQPFFVNANGNDLGANPGDGTPEVPLAVLLPLAGVTLVGGTLLIRRRRELLA